MVDRERGDLAVVQGAAVTLLSLLIGFSFSMAISRYEQRKNFEESEANAIGTEYVRADLLAAADGEKMRELQKARCRAHQPIGGLERDVRLEASECRFASGCRSLPTRLFPHPLPRSALDGLRFDRGKKTGQGMSHTSPTARQRAPSTQW